MEALSLLNTKEPSLWSNKQLEDGITLKGTLMISLNSGQSVLYLTDVWF